MQHAQNQIHSFKIPIQSEIIKVNSSLQSVKGTTNYIVDVKESFRGKTNLEPHVNEWAGAHKVNKYMKNIPGKEQSTHKGKQAGRAWGVLRTS